MVYFPGVCGESAVFRMIPTEAGYLCQADGVTIPAVISQRLVLGDGVPRVVLEIAVRGYDGPTKMLAGD